MPQKTADSGNTESASRWRPILASQCDLHSARIAAQWWAASSLFPSSVARARSAARVRSAPRASRIYKISIRRCASPPPRPPRVPVPKDVLVSSHPRASSCPRSFGTPPIKSLEEGPSSQNKNKALRVALRAACTLKTPQGKLGSGYRRGKERFKSSL